MTHKGRVVWFASLTFYKLPVFVFRRIVFLSWAWTLSRCAWLMENSLCGVSRSLGASLVECPNWPPCTWALTCLTLYFSGVCQLEAQPHRDCRLDHLSRCRLPAALTRVATGTWTRNRRVSCPQKASPRLACRSSFIWSVNGCLYGQESQKSFSL